jgi:hypothetical protein
MQYKMNKEKSIDGKKVGRVGFAYEISDDVFAQITVDLDVTDLHRKMTTIYETHL